MNDRIRMLKARGWSQQKIATELGLTRWRVRIILGAEQRVDPPALRRSADPMEARP
jgi:transcriptional regulator